MDAENVMQECFLKIFDNMNKLNEQKKFIAWIKSIAVNKSIDFMRKRNAKIDKDEAKIALNEEIGEIEKIREDVVVEKICKAIQKLPGGYRTIISLHLFEDYSFEEIAELLKIQPVSVRTQYSRGRKRVIEMLNEKTKNYGHTEKIHRRKQTGI
jgi:RNA polymerase sigma-70 factor (ECF subfamily)